VQYQSKSKLIKDTERYTYELDSDIEEEDDGEEEEGKETPKGTRAEGGGAPRKPQFYPYYSSSRGTEPVDSDFSDTASSSGLSSDVDDDGESNSFSPHLGVVSHTEFAP